MNFQILNYTCIYIFIYECFQLVKNDRIIHRNKQYIHQFEWQGTVQYSVVVSITCCILSTANRNLMYFSSLVVSNWKLNNIVCFQVLGECKNNHSFAIHDTEKICNMKPSHVNCTRSIDRVLISGYGYHKVLNHIFSDQLLVTT